MSRPFICSFTPPSLDPAAGATIALDVSEIEDAGICEVFQTPGAAYRAWSILDTLLSPTGVGTPFIFKQPLGQACEVKVALSDLFGSFVTRIYLRTFRNRIAHHEPIFAPHLGANYASLLQVAGWISAETRAWIERHNRVPAVRAQSPDDAALWF
ncbi:hypothetical protein [Parvibaculum sedimenti]|uniref:hypothetical protein n=1 Tax=Parvibaculum sedimenti TaxID=2608632 RepID=UPI00163A4803|nr:hypothetical protein [Parvibaculum sedimenti]